jgi:hypothetical protein
MIRNEEEKRLCQYCNPHSRASVEYGAKERMINEYLAKHFPETYAIGTYAPFRSCGDYKRPDTIIKCGTTLVIVENDEHHHRTYNLDCEWSKILQHIQSSMLTDGVEQILVIRFNPDEWVGENGETDDIATRLEALRDLIQDRFENQERFMEMYHMYYPGKKIEKVTDEDIALWIDYLRMPFEELDDDDDNRESV